MKKNEKLYLGIELGSTRIKSILTDENGKIYAKGSHNWENRLENGLWTYSEKDIHNGFSCCVFDLIKNYGVLPKISAIGVSAMMHGYIALDSNNNMLSPFITWRNTNAKEASNILTENFGVNIPMRWSIAQLYQAILNNESHIKDIAHLTTLSGYIHYKLTGNFVLGIGDASGMFPIDASIKDYNQSLLDRFDSLIADKGYKWKIRDILPKVLCAGESAGTLTKEGVNYIGADFPIGIKTAAPEGDGSTGMVATNSIKAGTGNISAGTSIFASVVTDKELLSCHTGIDPVATPDGKPVSMVHCNNCTSDINAWAKMLCQFACDLGISLSVTEVLSMMFKESEKAKGRLDSFINYNFVSGEPLADVENGAPVFMRLPDADFTFADFSKAHIYSCIASIAIGMDILYAEGVKLTKIYGHGGFFKTADVGQRAMSAAIGVPVSIMETAGEGGAWGMAVLTAFTDKNISLEEYLDKIFVSYEVKTLCATPKERDEFISYLKKYKELLSAEFSNVLKHYKKP